MKAWADSVSGFNLPPGSEAAAFYSMIEGKREFSKTSFTFIYLY